MAKRHAADNVGAGYTRGKAPVVLDIVNRARSARGLPPLKDLDTGAS